MEVKIEVNTSDDTIVSMPEKSQDKRRNFQLPGTGWYKDGKKILTHTVAPVLRGLNNILGLHVKRLNSTTWEPITILSRSIVALNLHSYASGRNPWGNLKPEYLQKVAFKKKKKMI
ncbi:hypothetical protein L2E82_27902 [Cichorium intybus]|uniref:Uncharacterized protein n=1 Tax=Cichorium intybus TaxID=13427 RepID=A0ACB9CUA9_CICIN|nr:hypothetical protein L2E82_27902 [Cichorium intybus]